MDVHQLLVLLCVERGLKILIGATVRTTGVDFRRMGKDPKILTARLYRSTKRVGVPCTHMHVDPSSKG